MGEGREEGVGMAGLEETGADGCEATSHSVVLMVWKEEFAMGQKRLDDTDCGTGVVGGKGL